MTDETSYYLLDLPENTYISPHFLFQWWDGVIRHNGSEAAVYGTGEEYKKARELWIAAMFATGKRKLTGKEHWVRAVQDIAPDAIVAYLERDELGFGNMMYSLEITTYGKYSNNIEEVLQSKLDKVYAPYTRIVCYITDRLAGEIVEPSKISEYVSNNNPYGYEVWLLSSVDREPTMGQIPFRLQCLTYQEDVVIDYNEVKELRNHSDAFRLTGRAYNRTGEPEFLGKFRLNFPIDEKRTEYNGKTDK